MPAVVSLQSIKLRCTKALSLDVPPPASLKGSCIAAGQSCLVQIPLMHGIEAVWGRPALSAWLEAHGASITLADRAARRGPGAALAWPSLMILVLTLKESKSRSREGVKREDKPLQNLHFHHDSKVWVASAKPTSAFNGLEAVSHAVCSGTKLSADQLHAT